MLKGWIAGEEVLLRAEWMFICFRVRERRKEREGIGGSVSRSSCSSNKSKISSGSRVLGGVVEAHVFVAVFVDNVHTNPDKCS